MARYKLTYFDFSGSRGDECRLALYVAGVDFDDNRISQPTFAALKPETPYGSLPILEEAGKPPLAQSNAILTYIGLNHDLLPRDAWEAAQHVSVLESVEELRGKLAPSGALKDPVAKKQAREDFAAGPLKTWARSVERRVRGPFVAGAAISVADIKVFQIMQSFKSGSIDHVSKDAFSEFPKLEALHAAVAQHAKVAEWRSRH
jgi:prostaglandin-H2 D-isomerase / glutathione transferase